MKDLKLNIFINRPIPDVFSYVLNSQNTNKWFPSIKEEVQSEYPAKLGTIYKNHGEDITNWSSYEITEFSENKTFTMSNLGNSYHVKYTFTLENNGTNLEYHEWVDDGELSDPTSIEPLQILKKNLESR